MALPPARQELSDVYPNPSNAVMRTGMGRLWDWLISVLGNAGSATHRNRVRNGNFTVNQRRLTGNITLAAGVYGHDGWKAGASGCTYYATQEGKDFYLNISAGSIVQIVEDKDIEGGYYRLSHGGTSQARIAVNGAGFSGSFAAAPMSSALATGGLPVAIEFGVGTVHKVQLEPGTAETAYTRLPYAVELAICQRYYYSKNTTGQGQVATGLAYLANTASFTVQFPQTMRAAPTMSSSNLYITTGSGATIAGQSSTISYFSGDSVSVGVGVSGSPLTVGQASILYCGNGAGGAINFSAEL